MRAFARIFCLWGLLAVLTGCAAPMEEPPAVEETVPPPVPQMVSLGEVTVDGVRLSGGSLLYEGVPYIRTQELTDALGIPPMSEPLVPVKEAIETFGLGQYADPAQEHLYLSTETGDWECPAGYRVPTLMYHGVSDDPWGFSVLFVSPADMEAQLQYLQENGFTTIHFSDLAQIDTIEKPVLLTFDDGYADNYTELFPLLQKYNAKATIFVVTGALDVNPNFMTWEQAREMADSGLVSIQSHTVSHRELDTLTLQEQKRELIQSKLDILRHIGREPDVLCYPSGRYNVDTTLAMDGLYRFGLKMDGGDYWTDHDSREINRWYIARDTDFYTFTDMVN